MTAPTIIGNHKGISKFTCWLTSFTLFGNDDSLIASWCKSSCSCCCKILRRFLRCLSLSQLSSSFASGASLIPLYLFRPPSNHLFVTTLIRRSLHLLLFLTPGRLSRATTNPLPDGLAPLHHAQHTNTTSCGGIFARELFLLASLLLRFRSWWYKRALLELMLVLTDEFLNLVIRVGTSFFSPMAKLYTSRIFEVSLLT